MQWGVWKSLEIRQKSFSKYKGLQGKKSRGNIRKVIVLIAKSFPSISCFGLQKLAVNVWKGNVLEVLWST